MRLTRPSSFFTLLTGLFLSCWLNPAWSDDRPSIIGAWESNVEITVPAGFPGFKDILTFHQGGTMTESHPLYVPLHPIGPLLYTPGHGNWRKKGEKYIATFIFYAQGAPGSDNQGEFVATNKVAYELTVNKETNQLIGTWRNRFTDAAGNLIISAGGNLKGNRIKPVSPDDL